MHLAGIPVRDEAILELARLVDDPALAAKLEGAYSHQVKILALEIHERETIIAALDDPPADLAELRAFCSGSSNGGAPKGLPSRAPHAGRGVLTTLSAGTPRAWPTAIFTS